MIGRCLSYWNSPFLGYMLVFRVKIKWSPIHFKWPMFVSNSMSTIIESGRVFTFGMLGHWTFLFNTVLYFFVWHHGNPWKPHISRRSFDSSITLAGDFHILLDLSQNRPWTSTSKKSHRLLPKAHQIGAKKRHQGFLGPKTKPFWGQKWSWESKGYLEDHLTVDVSGWDVTPIY